MAPTVELKIVGDVETLRRALNEDDASLEDLPAGVVRQIVSAAERGDRFAFRAAAERVGLDRAQAVVRSRGIVRMVDRAYRADQPSGAEARGATVEARDVAAGAAADGPTMFGHFAVFNEWTEINSYFEGNFLERLAPGAFKKTIRENGSDVKALFQHGADPQIGDKPLGPIRTMAEDTIGVAYEVDLIDAPYVRNDILPGLEADLYGASFRFQALREEFADEPGVSADNPKGLPERTLKEVRLYEFGPVTFPAYPAATAGVRNADVGDESVEADSSRDASQSTTAPATDDAETSKPSHLEPARRGNPADLAASPYTLKPRKEAPSWLI